MLILAPPNCARRNKFAGAGHWSESKNKSAGRHRKLRLLSFIKFGDGDAAVESSLMNMLNRLAFFFCALLGQLPPAIRIRIGEFLGAAAMRFSSRRRIALRNLELCFPQMPEAERAAHVKNHFRLLGRSLLDRLHLLTADGEKIRRLVSVAGLEHWRSLEGQATIVFAPHFVGMDFGGVRLICESSSRLSAVYREQHSGFWNELLHRARARHLPSDMQLFSHRESLGVCRWLRGGGGIYYLPDLNEKRRPLFSQFFAVDDAATTDALSRLARVGRARVLPCATYLQEGGGYLLQLHPPWENFPSGDAAADARRMNQFIEERIMESIAQYYWVHRRFKTRPPGASSLYD